MIYFSMGGWCLKFSNYMGHWCPTKSNYMGGWYFAAWKGKKEYYLPTKERSFIKSSQKESVELSKPHRKQPFLFIRNCQNSDVSVEYW